jgi:uncharacterized protein
MHPDPEQLNELIRQIVEAVHPLEIVLFGSAARGEMGRHSDIDLLVVVPEGTRRLDVAKHLYRVVGGVGVPFDIVVATPGDLEKYGDTPGFVFREIARDGRRVYAA